MRASAGHVAYKWPAQTVELTRHLRDTTPATIVRADNVNDSSSNGAATEIVWTRSAADQLMDMERGDDWKRYVPIIGAKPGYIPFTQPERATLDSLAKLERTSLLFDYVGVPSSSATAPALPPPSE